MCFIQPPTVNLCVLAHHPLKCLYLGEGWEEVLFRHNRYFYLLTTSIKQDVKFQALNRLRVKITTVTKFVYTTKLSRSYQKLMS